MKAIYDSINDRSKIKATLYNIRGNFKDIRTYEKLLNTPILAKDINEGKVRAKVNSLINEAVNELAGIESLCKIYHELCGSEFQETKEALHKIVNRQKLVPCNNII
jgi:hypothetical protein